MADKTLTITVASGSQYPSGTGDVYYIDGVRPGDWTVTWLADATLRFDLSDSSNDGHPLVFSTSNSTNITTFRAGVFSTNVVYYLDGVVGSGDWLTPADFNAATTRYIEISPADFTGFYWGCYSHGVGMGGIMAMDAELWGAASWNSGAWGNQDDLALDVTGQSITTSLATVLGVPSSGWGRAGWGKQDWGEATNTFTLNSQLISIGLGTVITKSSTGWGRETWGSSSWGAYGTALLSGEAIATAVGTPTIVIYSEAGWGALTWGENAWGAEGDVVPVGQTLTTSLASVTVTAEVNLGWGRGRWGYQVWGDRNEAAAPTGINIATTVASATVTTEVNTGWGRLTWGENAWGIFGQTQLTGQSVGTNLGTVTISAEINTGWGRQTWGYGSWGDSGHAVALTGQVITTAVGNESSITDVTVIAATNNIGTTLADVIPGINSDPIVTGIAMSVSAGTLNTSIWTEINPNVSMVWTEIAA